MNGTSEGHLESQVPTRVGADLLRLKHRLAGSQPPVGVGREAPLTAGEPVLWLRVGPRLFAARAGSECPMNAVGCDRKGDENPENENRRHFAS